MIQVPDAMVSSAGPLHGARKPSRPWHNSQLIVRKIRTFTTAEAKGREDSAQPTDTPVDALAPFRRTASFWNWLPAFRAVAEWGGVLRAARTLRTSASSLSRAVRLLEDAVGEALFRREGRVLVLTPAGEELLAATRFAMRSVDDVTSGDAAQRGPLRAASTSRLAMMRLLPALSAVRRRSPSVVATVTSVKHAGITQALLTAKIDVAISHARVEHPELVSVALTPARSAVFCAPTHPLWKTPSASVERVLAYPFAAPTGEASGTPADGWPDHLPRTIALQSSIIDPGVDACVRGELLAVLPLEIVEAHAAKARLRALRSIPIPATSLFAIRRRTVTAQPVVTDLVMEALSRR